jgi:Ser-tRNA(Ala) deacylase AlaX
LFTMALQKAQYEPYLTSFQTIVVDIQPMEKAHGKDKKKAPKAENSNENEVKATEEPNYRVELADSILYAEGGGQPTDFGKIVKNDKSFSVLNVQTDPKNNKIYHWIYLANANELSVNDSVTAELDWDRRYDHMQHHTGQHLISAIANQPKYNLPTMSWWLASYPAECHIEFNHTELISAALLSALESEINIVIRSAVSLQVHLYNTAEEFQASQEYQQSLISGRNKEKSFPSDFKGPIRFVSIPGTDFNACGGTHLANISEIQAIKLTRQEKSRGNIKIYFLAGFRLLNSLSNALNIQKELSNLLSIGPEGHISAAKRLLDEQKANFKATNRYLGEIAQFEADKLLNQLKSGSYSNPENKAHALLESHREEATLNYLNSLADLITASTFVTEMKKTGQENSQFHSVWLYLTCTDSSVGSEGQFLLLAINLRENDKEFTENLAKNYLNNIGAGQAKIANGRGGGRGKFQGKASNLGGNQSNRGAALHFIQQELSKLPH